MQPIAPRATYPSVNDVDVPLPLCGRHLALRATLACLDLRTSPALAKACRSDFVNFFHLFLVLLFIYCPFILSVGRIKPSAMSKQSSL
jgi:hypothetical protein